MVVVVLSQDEVIGAACAAELASGEGREVVVVPDGAAVAALHGPVDVLVTVPRHVGPGRPAEHPMGYLEDVQQAVAHVVGGMVERGRGRVVLVVTATALPGQSWRDGSGPSMWGVVGLARAAAREVAAHGVTVNVVRTGTIDLDGQGPDGDGSTARPGRAEADDVPADDPGTRLAAKAPLKRAGTPDDVAAAVGFLASDDASYVTGIVLPVDGGLTMGLGA